METSWRKQKSCSWESQVGYWSVATKSLSLPTELLINWWQTVALSAEKTLLWWTGSTASIVRVTCKPPLQLFTPYLLITWLWLHYATLKRRITSTGLHGAISQKAVIFKESVDQVWEKCVNTSVRPWTAQFRLAFNYNFINVAMLLIRLAYGVDIGRNSRFYCPPSYGALVNSCINGVLAYCTVVYCIYTSSGGEVRGTQPSD
jgi:hypothetical protein